jgi:hypothetical protein
MPHLPLTHHETSNHDSPNETKVKEKQNETVPNLNSNLTKSMTHHNQAKELTTWFLLNASTDMFYLLKNLLLLILVIFKLKCNNLILNEIMVLNASYVC